nr:leucyl/phenylalanyl-tRNA--protein transferase [Catenovulum sediminis]
MGGDLSVERLISAYSNGIFPWYNPGEPILWWSPDPRGVIKPEQITANRSLKKSIRKYNYRFTLNQCFSAVIDNCAKLRERNEGTWINKDIQTAYNNLHRAGYAHSLEVWSNDQLVGGLYGVLLGSLFCGESMFHLKTDASKAAFNCLGKHCLANGVQLIDCQMVNPHLQTLGVYEMPRKDFLKIAAQLIHQRNHSKSWLPQELNYGP